MTPDAPEGRIEQEGETQRDESTEGIEPPEPSKRTEESETDGTQSVGEPVDTRTTSNHSDNPASDVDTQLPEGSAQTGIPDDVSTPAGFDWRGWLLVGVVFLSFLVIPGFVLLIPEAHGVISALGFSIRQAYIVFPMLPAILLGSIAVWAAIRSQSPNA